MKQIKTFVEYETVDLDIQVNKWIKKHPEYQIIDIKFSTSDKYAEVLIIYEEILYRAEYDPRFIKMCASLIEDGKEMK